MYTYKQDFDRVRITVSHKEPDIVPLGELHIDDEVIKAFLNTDNIDNKRKIDFFVNAGYDFVTAYASTGLTKQPVVSNEQRVSETDTSYGSSKKRDWVDENIGIIKNREDFKKHPWPSIEDYNSEQLDEYHRLVPEGMGIVSGVGGIFECTWQMMGFENFVMTMADDFNLIEMMFERISSLFFDSFKKTVAEKKFISGMWYSDDIAYTEGLFVSPDIIKKYSIPLMKKMGRLCKDNNLVFFYHSDGDIRQLIGDFIGAGVDILQPIEPKAMDITELKKKYGKNISFMGNIDLGYTLTRGSVDEVEEEVKKRIKDIAPGGGYLLGSSNSVTNYVPIENFRAMVKARNKYGRYPIRIT